MNLREAFRRSCIATAIGSIALLTVFVHLTREPPLFDPFNNAGTTYVAKGTVRENFDQSVSVVTTEELCDLLSDAANAQECVNLPKRSLPAYETSAYQENWRFVLRCAFAIGLAFTSLYAAVIWVTYGLRAPADQVRPSFYVSLTTRLQRSPKTKRALKIAQKAGAQLTILTMLGIVLTAMQANKLGALPTIGVALPFVYATRRVHLSQDGKYATLAATLAIAIFFVFVFTVSLAHAT